MQRLNTKKKHYNLQINLEFFIINRTEKIKIINLYMLIDIDSFIIYNNIIYYNFYQLYIKMFHIYIYENI